MAQTKYQGYARERGFNPVQVSTESVGAIGQQGDNLLRQMRDNSDTERRNRSAYQSQLERNQGIEAQNRAANRDFERRNDERVFNAAQLNRKIGIDNAFKRQQDVEKTFEALSNFSGTLAKTVTDWKAQKDERDKLAEYEYEKIYGSSDQEITQVQTQLNAIYNTDAVIQNTADGLQASNAAPEVVHSVRKLSSAGKIGQALARFEAATRRYPGWLDQQRLENSSLEIQYVDPATGVPTVITPQSAVGPEQTRIVSQALFKQYIKENGFLDYKPGLAAPFLKTMREAEQRVLEESRMSYNIASSEQLLEETKSSVVPELRTNPGSAFNRLTQAYARSLDERGRPLGYRAAREKAQAFIRQGIDVGQIDRAAIDLIKASPTAHQPNKTWGELYEYEFAKLSEEIDNNYLEDARREDSLLQQEGKEWTTKALADMASNPPSKDTIQQLIKYSIDEFGSVDDRLQYYANNFTQEKLDADTLNKEFEALAQSNRLTTEMVTDPRIPWTVRQQWENIARQQSNARSQTGDFKASEEAIESAILAAAKWNSATGDPKHYTIPLATAEAKANFNKIVSNLLKGGKATPEQAAQQALQQVIADIGDGTLPGRFQYSQTDQGGFINIGFSGYGTSREAAFAASKHMEAIKAKFDGGGGAASLDRFALIPRQILEQINSVRDTPNVQPPPIAQYISDLVSGQISPWEVMNRQLVAQGFKALPVPEPMQQVNQTISPTLRNLLLYKPSPNRSYRAYTSAPQFNPTLVPNGYGQLIAEVASANGVDPGLLAGLVKVESGFNANAVSRSGAIGLGQLMPGTAQELGVNPRDPRQNLQGAARYLRKMNDMFAGDQTAALRAYNQGPGNQQRYPNGVSEEARSYPRKVLQAAAAFGYNPNGGSPWRTEATMRPKLVYRIDSIGPTSTGPHLDVKDTGGRNFGRYDLDKYIEVEVKGRRKPISTVMTDDQAAHRKRGSHGIDFAYPAGTPVFLKNGARVVSNSPTEHGDKLVIQLPNGRTFSFLHGRKA
jgi:murein DD-endopeptidase MepM/ murein hydrolase activator NlpD